MYRQLQQLARDEQGVATVEYALLVCLIAIACIGAWMGLATKVKTSFLQSTNSLSQPLG